MFDATEQVEALRPELDAALGRVFASGRFLAGVEGEAFERAFAAQLGPDFHGVGVGCGTDALLVALSALGVGPGDEVVTVPNTAVATVSAIRQAGARPVLCDVDPVTGLMDPAQLGACLGPATRAVVPVHLYGNVVDVPRIRSILGERAVRIVEDCAQAHGARLGERMAGTMGDAAAFSFYPTKNLGAFGDAGLCATRDPELAGAMRSVRSYGAGADGQILREGICSRLDELQAALLSVKLRHLDDFLARRRSLAARYDERLDPSLRRVPAAAGVSHGYHLYVVRVRDRDEVRARMSERGVATAVHYPIPIHRMPVYGDLARAGELPAAEAWAEEILSLPLYPELPPAAVDRVADALNEATR